MNDNTTNGITRKGFMGALGATLLALPLSRNAAGQTAGDHPAPSAKPDVIRQAELKAIFQDLEAVSARILGFRRRMVAGAAVECGSFAAEFSPGALEPEDAGSSEWGMIEQHGIWLGRTEDAYATLTHERSTRGRQAPGAVAAGAPHQMLSTILGSPDRQVKDATVSTLRAMVHALSPVG